MMERKSYALIDKTTLPFLLMYLGSFVVVIYFVYFII